MFKKVEVSERRYLPVYQTALGGCEKSWSSLVDGDEGLFLPKRYLSYD